MYMLIRTNMTMRSFFGIGLRYTAAIVHSIDSSGSRSKPGSWSTPARSIACSRARSAAVAIDPVTNTLKRLSVRSLKKVV